MSGIEPNENNEDDLTTYSVDDEDQLQPEDTLEDGDLDDVLDRGYSPNDRPQGVNAHGTTAYEESIDETIDERIRQEVPDPNSAYGAPDNESGLDDDRIGATTPTPSTPRTTGSVTTRSVTRAPGGWWPTTRVPTTTTRSRRGRATSASTVPAPRPRRPRCTSSTRSPTSPTRTDVVR